MAKSPDARIAVLEQQVADLRTTLASVNEKLDTIDASLNRGKGALAAVVSIAGVGGAAAYELLSHLWK